MIIIFVVFEKGRSWGTWGSVDPLWVYAKKRHLCFSYTFRYFLRQPKLEEITSVSKTEFKKFPWNNNLHPIDIRIFGTCIPCRAPVRKKDNKNRLQT
jgi:hypothetical protein